MKIEYIEPNLYIASYKEKRAGGKTRLEAIVRLMCKLWA